MIFSNSPCGVFLRMLGSVTVCVYHNNRVTKVSRLLKGVMSNILKSEDDEFSPCWFQILEQIGGKWAAEALLNIPSHKKWYPDQVVPLLVKIGERARAAGWAHHRTGAQQTSTST